MGNKKIGPPRSRGGPEGTFYKGETKKREENPTLLWNA